MCKINRKESAARWKVRQDGSVACVSRKQEEHKQERHLIDSANTFKRTKERIIGAKGRDCTRSNRPQIQNHHHRESIACRVVEITKKLLGRNFSRYFSPTVTWLTLYNPISNGRKRSRLLKLHLFVTHQMAKVSANDEVNICWHRLQPQRLCRWAYLTSLEIAPE